MKLPSLLMSALLSGVALAAPVAPARANDCVDEAIAQCDKRYPPDKPWLLSLRGYCYLILAGGCVNADQT
jgi:hypothetical protein